MTIYFYVEREVPYGCFSNFSAHGFMLDDLYWRTSEHYFQAQKFVGSIYLEKIRGLKAPKDAANMGRNRALPLRLDWEQVKDEVMRRAVLQKFQSGASQSCRFIKRMDGSIYASGGSQKYFCNFEMLPFQSHGNIREILLSTGDELLVENAPGDYYWGCGKDGSGKNKLGEILMEVRGVLR
jgi:N-glycosidase YbiA